MITYQLTILDPSNTAKTLSQRECTLTDWDQVECQINADRAQFYECSKLPIKFQAHDETVILNGSFGV